MKKLMILLPILLLIFAAAAEDGPEYHGYPTVQVGNVATFTIDLGDQSAVYLPLDDLGRVQGAAAILGPNTAELRSVITSIRPTGWQQASYPFVSGLNLFNRTHLIAHQLNGEDRKENILTGTQYMNITGMKPIEDFVADYIRLGNSVHYEVRPLFVGDELVCRGVFINAASIGEEDLVISVFCFNLQPGVVIDYASGASAVAPTSAKLDPPEEITREIPMDPEAPVLTYVLNIKSKRFHLPGCSGVMTMKTENRQDYYGDRDELIEMGYKPCGTCNP